MDKTQNNLEEIKNKENILDLMIDAWWRRTFDIVDIETGVTHTTTMENWRESVKGDLARHFFLLKRDGMTMTRGITQGVDYGDKSVRIEEYTIKLKEEYKSKESEVGNE